MPVQHRSGIVRYHDGMDWSLTQLRGFVAVAEELHFGRAAERLRLTQPPLTRQIQGLERSLSLRLLERGGRQVRLTPAGEAFLADARRILAVVDAAPEAARRVAAGEVGTIRLSFTAVGAYAILDRFLDLIGGRLPGVTVALSEAISADQYDALASLQVDLALARPPVPDGFASRLVHREPMVLAVPDDHPLAPGRRPVRLADITDGYLGYHPEQARYLHDVCAAMLGLDRFLSSERVSQIPTMLALVRARRGLALVPRSATAMGVQGVTYRPLTRADAPVVELHACWQPDTPNPAVRRLLDHLDTITP
jgi:DNA-binding transcriptional LysR family regulator